MASKKKKTEAPVSTEPVALREYELIYILRGGVAPESAQAIAERMQVLIDDGGKMLRVDNWGRRRMAYPIAGSNRGVYVCLRFLGGPTVVKEMERQLKLSDDVIRYQTVLIARDVDASSYEVSPDDVAFAPIEPAPEDDEPGFAQRLGLVETPRVSVSRNENDAQGDDEDSDDDAVADDDDDSQQAASEEGAPEGAQQDEAQP